MCNSRTCGGEDHCCKESCEEYEGIRPCPGAVALPSTLMLGNSYTFYNGGVDGTLRSFFVASRRSWYIKALTLGGSNWQYHLAQASVSGTPHYSALTASNGGENEWGFVVFQEQSHVPGLCCHTSPMYTDSTFASSAQAVVELDRMAAARGARTVLYQTWGRRDGHKTRPYIGTFTAMNDAVIEGYKHYASLITHAGRVPVVAPVGVAFRLIYDDVVAVGQDPADSSSLFHKLYDPDASHPSALGTYLAACVLFGSITGGSPKGLPPALGISETEASMLQETAQRAISKR